MGKVALDSFSPRTKENSHLILTSKIMKKEPAANASDKNRFPFSVAKMQGLGEALTRWPGQTADLSWNLQLDHGNITRSVLV